MKKKILVLGITGSFGSGKTTVAVMFKRLGASCIDADKIYHQLLRPEGPVYKRIVSAFGQEILGRKKQIDRKKLANVVFDKRKALKRLCQISHPVIISSIKSTLSKSKRIGRHTIIVIDAPLLIEAGLIEMINKLIVVKANKRNQIKRIRKQWGLSRNEIIMRIKAQTSLSEKIKLADYVIDNNGTLKQTRKQVKDIWKKINTERSLALWARD